MKNAEETLKDTFKILEKRLNESGTLGRIESAIKEAVNKGLFSCEVEVNLDCIENARFLIDYLEKLGYKFKQVEQAKYAYMQGPGEYKVRDSIIRIEW